MKLDVDTLFDSIESNIVIITVTVVAELRLL